MTYIPPQKLKQSAFGDTVIAEIHPVIAIKSTYGIRTDAQTFVDAGASGSVTASGNEFSLQTGTTVGGYGILWSRRPLVYMPGVGVECRITGRFSSGVASSMQAVGFFSAINGMFFGYNGTSFGTMHRYGGAIEIRKLTITTGSSTNTTATVSLNGVNYTAAVTNSGSVTTTAHEIVDGLNAGAAALLWTIQHINDHIIFVYRGSGSKSDAYLLSFATGTGAGTFSQLKAGAAPTETWTAKANWNADTCSWLNPALANIYKMEFAHLGYGPLKYSVFNPTTRDFTLAHVIEWANTESGPNFNNPSMRPGWVSASLGSSTNLTVNGCNAMAALQGNADISRPFSAVGTVTGVTTQTQVLTITVRDEFNSRAVNGVIKPILVSISTDSTKGAIFRIYRSPTVAGTTVHQYVDQNESMVTYDTAGTTVSGGRILGSYTVGPSGSLQISFDDDLLDLIAGDELVITAQVISGAAADMSASIVWKETI